MDTKYKRIAIFASGAGSNALEIIKQSATVNANYKVALIVCNKPTAGVLQIAAQYHIPTLLIEKKSFFETNTYLAAITNHQIDLIVLAGFLWKIPVNIIQAFPNNIINIHPALLPKYGGKGMYGMYVHEAVVLNKETETGITIHYVNENYDEGKMILQKSCAVIVTDTPTDVANKVHSLEHQYFSQVINELCKN
jgi:phosphoribosylglycinamide formyltransferase 1